MPVLPNPGGYFSSREHTYLGAYLYPVLSSVCAREEETSRVVLQLASCTIPKILELNTAGILTAH